MLDKCWHQKLFLQYKNAIIASHTDILWLTELQSSHAYCYLNPNSISYTKPSAYPKPYLNLYSKPCPNLYSKPYHDL